MRGDITGVDAAVGLFYLILAGLSFEMVKRIVSTAWNSTVGRWTIRGKM